MKELTGRSAMKSPGKPSHRREVERWFWREIAKGLSSEGAAHASYTRMLWTCLKRKAAYLPG
jgi:hypothetical protein